METDMLHSRTPPQNNLQTKKKQKKSFHGTPEQIAHKRDSFEDWTVQNRLNSQTIHLRFEVPSERTANSKTFSFESASEEGRKQKHVLLIEHIPGTVYRTKLQTICSHF